MKELNYSIKIKASKSHVWNTMLEPEKYKQWAKAFSEASQFEGTWEQGKALRFIDPALGGTKAVLDIFEPYNCILARHIAMITKDGNEDRDSDAARQWIGTTEKYVFTESRGETILRIEMSIHPAFVEMFDSCWPKALKNIKSLSED